MGGTWVVTGANRGIGLEFARQLSERGDRVVATARRPAEARELARLPVSVEPLDVADDASVAEFARRLGGKPVDVLVHNAAVGVPGPSIEGVRTADLEYSFRVNAIGPLALTRILLPNLRAGRLRRIVVMSSGLGSVATNDSGGWYAYRASKAALNQIVRTLAQELRPEAFVCIAMSPGWVRTEMGGAGAPLSPEESVRGILRVVDRLGPSDTSRFLNHRGETVSW